MKVLYTAATQIVQARREASDSAVKVSISVSKRVELGKRTSELISMCMSVVSVCVSVCVC